jgi:hypothetical protein
VGLYLAVFRALDEDDELDGVEVGGYDDFDGLRSTIADRLEGGQLGSRFPTFSLHADSDGTWEPSQIPALIHELETIRAELRRLPAAPFPAGWQTNVASEFGLRPENLAGSFIDINGDLLLDRLLSLAAVASAASQPIWFQ